MIIISSRKFRDSQNEYFQKALQDEVILKTLHYGSFKLVPVTERVGESAKTSALRKSRSASAIKPKSQFSTKQYESLEVENSYTPKTAADNFSQSPINSSDLPAADKKESMDIKQADHWFDQLDEAPEISRGNSELAEGYRAPDDYFLANPDKFDEDDSSTKEDEPQAPVNSYRRFVSGPDGKVRVIESGVSPRAEYIAPAGEGSAQKKVESKGNVYVDPSLLTLEEAMKQEGLGEKEKKGGFFGRLFGSKKK